MGAVGGTRAAAGLRRRAPPCRPGAGAARGHRVKPRGRSGHRTAARLRLQRAGAALAATFLATCGLAITGVAQAARTPSATPSPTPASASNRVTLTLVSLEPKAVQPHDTIVLEGTITNISRGPLTSVSVAARASTSRITT